MSCLRTRILPQLAAISGLPLDRLGQMMDVARRQSLPPLPLDAAVVDAVMSGLRIHHDLQQVEATLQMVAQGLRLALRQSRDRPLDARARAMLTALTGTILPDIPSPDLQLVQTMRTDLCLRPAPLPLTLPDNPDARRRAVLAAVRVGAWTDEEADRIAPHPVLAGLAWALGVQHPRIRAVVEESIEAAAAALSAGATDPDLLRRVTTDARPFPAAKVLATSIWNDPRLIARAAERPWTAAEVLAARQDIADPALIAAAAREPEPAAKVLAARQDIADPDLIAAAARKPDAAAKVLTVRPDITDPALIRAAAWKPDTAAKVLAARKDITDPALIRAAAREPEPAAKVLAARQDIADPALIRAAARDPKTAATMLTNRQDLASPHLIATAAKQAEAAAKVLAARQDIADPDLIRVAAWKTDTAAKVLAARKDITDPALIAAAAAWPHTAAQVLAARSDLTDPALIAAAAAWPHTAAQVLAARSDLTDPALIAAAAQDSDTAMRVLVARQDITDPALIAAAANRVALAVEVLVARQDITDPALIAAAAQEPEPAVKVLAVRRDLRSRRDVLDRVGQHRTVAHAVVDALGPYPALWQALPAPLRDEIAVRYRMSPSERAWIEGLATRTPPAWTEADDRIAARFPWHAALRDRLCEESAR